ncbi:MAG: hypothetical protein ACOCU4_01185 [Alkalispirochaeta sp.]
MVKTSRLVLITAILLFSVGALVSAGGQREDPVRRARELVSENRINDAILLLEQAVREDPDRIQDAEALMRTIREIRGEYNVLFEQLIDNLINNPDDIERTLQIIDQMEDLDEFPNERVVEQVQDARIVAQLAFDRNLFNQRMDEARTLLQQGDYVAAVNIYRELDSLQRERFEERGYGDIFISNVNRLVEEIDAVAIDFSQVLPSYQQAGRQVLQQAENDILTLGEDDLTPFFSQAERVASILDRAETTAQELAVTRSQVPLQFPDDPVDWYLNFQDMIARGRGEYREEEGVLFAVRDAYRGTVGQLAETGRTQTEELFELAAGDFEADRFSRGQDRYATASQTAALWERAEMVELGIFESEPDLATAVDSAGAGEAAPAVAARARRRVSESLVELGSVMSGFVERSLDRDATLFSLRSQLDSVQATVGTLQSGRSELEEAIEPIQALPTASMVQSTEEVISRSRRRWEESIARAMDRERQLVVAISTSQTEGFVSEFEELDEQMAELEPLNQGIEEQTGDDETAVRTVRYPDDALEGYEEVNERLAEMDTTLADADEELAGANEYVLESPLVQDERERLADLRERNTQLLNESNRGINDAESLIAQAEEAAEQADDLIADTRAAIAAGQIEPARNNYAAARDAFLASLELRENPDLRDESDAIIQQVGDELQELENVIVVRQVRELITRAEDLYGQDNYVGARDALLEAQETWAQTNVEPNSEVERLLRLVTAALSLEEGRELTATDPLYPILGNYLSIAREDFNAGVAAYDSGNEQRGDELFDRTIENLRNIRDVRPLNWDARILELRIAQVRNEDDFDEVFASRYEQAVSRLDEAGPLEVYSELEVLAEINPDYPGIQAQIRELEIALNLRENPVDQANINRSRELFQRAQQLSTGSRDQAAVAVSLLEDAVDANPNNSDAKFLLDQLRIRLGGQSTVALTSADEQQYRRAQTLFSQGRALQALQITERLLQDAENRTYPPLVELRRRIGLRLGI